MDYELLLCLNATAEEKRNKIPPEAQSSFDNSFNISTRTTPLLSRKHADAESNQSNHRGWTVTGIRKRTS